ncbi:(Fe-S)-binding protein [Bremerella alba]|uniref:Lactate utilization protein A n=1 Tax=Bremerella alba TaxID=980252 RepID=A0A7V8V1F7_9BACT|nr:(Fe-S)-binding protein [Bremerella alba]MBA2113193.1 Lactate utilization protein A [Bremerella alba]
MRVALFVPCYVDQLYPRVAMATLELLEQLGVEVEFPEAQTCCGQPMLNSGCDTDALPLAERFVEIFSGYDAIVCPSGSCVSMVKNHYNHLLHDNAKYDNLRTQIYELCEFLVDVLKIDSLPVKFPYKVGLHSSCHGLRELRLASDSELNTPAFNKPRQLLELLDGVEFAELKRQDECCGFGGTFAVSEEAVSCTMGRDRIADHLQAGTQVLTAGDMSCLMHLAGLIKREKQPIRVMHIAEILAGYEIPQ